MNDPYLDELEIEFKAYSVELKKLKQKLLKSNSSSEQSNIVKKIDSIAGKMEKNQRQTTKVKTSRIKNFKKNKR